MEDPPRRRASSNLSEWAASSSRRSFERPAAPFRSAAPPPPRTAVKKHHTLGNLADLALHGSRPAHHMDDRVFLQHLSSAAARGVPSTKLDTVSFTWSDRAAAWLSGWGRELRQLKEMRLDDALQADGTRAADPSRLVRVHRLSAVLAGAEEALVRRANPTAVAADGDLRGLTSAQLVRAMCDMMRRAHFEATAFGLSYARASAEEIRDAFDAFHDEHELTLFERLYLRFATTDADFSQAERDTLLGRSPGARRGAAAAADSTHHELPEQQQQQQPGDCEPLSPSPNLSDRPPAGGDANGDAVPVPLPADNMARGSSFSASGTAEQSGSPAWQREHAVVLNRV